MFPQDTARPSTFQLDGPATPHIDARIADTHLHLHGMAWYGFAQFLIPAAISYSVSLDILRHHSPSSLPHFSSTLISPSSLVCSPLFSPLIHDFIRLTSPVPLFTETRALPCLFIYPHAQVSDMISCFTPAPNAPCALSVFVLVLCI